MVTLPSAFESSGWQSPSGSEPKAMLTPLTSSSTVTKPLPSQSPTHAATGAVAVGVGEGSAGE